jgi:hypothetical protein
MVLSPAEDAVPHLTNRAGEVSDVGRLVENELTVRCWAAEHIRHVALHETIEREVLEFLEVIIV